MAKFSISTDSSMDLHKSYLQKNGVYCINIKRVVDGEEISELYDSNEEFDNFYESLKKNANPKTAALNSTEMQEHFKTILNTEKDGDIIHLSLSSGLSATYDNAVSGARDVNKTLSGRAVFVVDSLIATFGSAMLVDELIKLRDSGATTQAAIKRVEYLRDHLQGWVIMNDLFHLNRGGRISGIKATIGTILNIKPIICVNNKGKLAMENKMKGNTNAINYVLGKMNDLGQKAGEEFFKNTVYLVRTSVSKLFDELKAAVRTKHPDLKYKEAIVGPVIGTHLGYNAAILLFVGKERLNIN